MSRRTSLAAVGLVVALSVAGCGTDQLAKQFPRLIIDPVLGEGQAALRDPAGIDLAAVPLYGESVATFKLTNKSSMDLKISAVTVASSERAQARVLSFPEFIGPQASAEMYIAFTPLERDVVGIATAHIESNAGPRGEDTTPVQIRGTGLFLGEPNLQACYGGTCHDLPEACTQQDGVCVLPALAFGNVSLDSTATQLVRLRNLPPAGTCLPPPTQDACWPVCVLTFAPNNAATNLGIGVTDTSGGFALDSQVTLPFNLGTQDPACVEVSDVSRSELRVPVAFASGNVERLDVASTLVLESNQPGAQSIHLPLVASAREGPVAVATLRACDAENPPPQCSSADDIQPLGRVYFDGRQSYHPVNTSALLTYEWHVIEQPDGADAGTYDFSGTDTTDLFSMWLPVAGRYVVRLQVSTDGIQSGVSATSDVEFWAVPESRLHVELLWDDPQNDLDLHVTNVAAGDLVYSSTGDCYWKNCDMRCVNNDDCTPVQWFSESAPLEEANPRLDIDDTNGLGPENINIDAPRPGEYRIYVHYYGLVEPIGGNTTATVRVYLDGILRAEMRRFLTRNDLWKVARITWNADDTATVTQATPDEPGKSGAVKSLQFAPYPGGHSFGGTF